MTTNHKQHIIGACPLDCPDACSWVVTMGNGKPVKLRGNPDHPFSRGTLCVKVNPYIAYSQHPDRLLYPQRRIGAKGEGRFTRISWDEALDEITERMRDTIATHGAEAIWPYAGTGTMGFVQGANGGGQRLFNALGTSIHAPTICSVSGHVGMSYTTGNSAGMDPEDLAHAGVIILWGTNTLVSNRHLWPFIQQGKKNGAILVVIDPMKTKTAQRADIHIAPKPGTDGALALGLMQALVDVGGADTAYLKERTVGWDEFCSQILPTYTPEYTAQLCGITAAEVRHLAEIMADNGPIGIRPLMGMQRHAGGGQAARVISCIPAVTGDFQRQGGGICYSTMDAYEWNRDALCGTHLRQTPARTIPMTRLGGSLLELNDPPIQMLIMWAANPVVSNPDSNRVRQGLARPDLFTVVIENFQTDTADYADILLPSTMQLEHADMHDSFSHLYINWNEPVMDPPGECLPHTEIFRRLAKRMNLTELALYDSDEDIARSALASGRPSMGGITLEKLKEKGWLRVNHPTPYQPFLARFQTDSGKFEFRSERAAVDGVGLFPNYVPPYEAVEDAAEASGKTVALISPANNFLLNSMFANSPDHAKSGSPVVVISPTDATLFNLHNDSMVRVWNGRGEFTARLAIKDDVRPGVAMTSKGLWAKHHGGSGVNATVMERDSDMGQGAVFHDNRVYLSPV
ncbi:MAG: molybdopterin-dependent oxidoreductase [Chloroflexota bacterium]